MFKRIFFTIIMLTLLLIAITVHKPVSIYLANMLDNQNKVVISNSNEYKRHYSFHYINSIDDYVPYSYQGLMDIIYNVLNNGWEQFVFYCPIEYVDCIKDIKDITKDNDILTHINNFVHPFNNFSKISTTVDSGGQITLDIQKLYTEKQIEAINFKVTEIINKYVEDDMTLEEKIKIVHDYIVLNTKYDMDKVDDNSPYYSNTAYGNLLQGYGICSGYADSMAIFLTKFEVPNFKISSETHVWNALYINNNWYHLDATWDDQIDSNGKENLIHKFFIINSANLKKYASTDHDFDLTVYQEFRYN